jgi:transglutaminase-like putative cysteine protease
MAIHVALYHKTHYRYDRPVTLSPHVVRLRPAPHCRTPILSYSLSVAPEKHFLNWQQDPHSNYLARTVFPETTRELLVEVDLVAEMAVYNPFDFFLEPSAEQFPFQYEPWLCRELAPFLEQGAEAPALTEFVRTIDRRPRRTVDFLVELNLRLSKEVAYVIRLEPGVQSPDDTLKAGRGSCRDTSWLLVQSLRRLGLAARFVSGYLIQLVPDVKPLDGPAGAAADFTDLHAWAEVYLPGAGWVGLDPTSGLLAGEGHIPLAATPEPSSAAPLTGTLDQCEAELVHEMHVRRIYESPRVTKPYSEDQWTAIDALGRRIDGELSRGDVRLTMGGEPTFVSIDDMDGAEWNIAALGPQKRQRAGALGEEAATPICSGQPASRRTGQVVSRRSRCRAGRLGAGGARRGAGVERGRPVGSRVTWTTGTAPSHAQRFITALADRLGVDSAHALRPTRIPGTTRGANGAAVNVDPLARNYLDEEEQRALSRVFEQHLDRHVGYVFRCAGNWTSNPCGTGKAAWFLRSEHLFLVPGDSPIGYRLPLDSPAVG